MTIELHDQKSAPADSRAVLAAIGEANGFTPNLFRALANSPSTLNGFAAFVEANDRGALSPAERQIVQLAASVENEGGYCVAGHTAFATRLGVPDDTLTAIRKGQRLLDERQQALVDITRALIRSRGHLADGDRRAFESAGFAPEQLLEVIAGIALKTVTNYVSNGLALPLDSQFQPYSWSHDPRC
jgi:uncharacterized peroxidase-related enzyme